MSRNRGRAPRREQRVIIKRPGRRFKRLNVVAGQIGTEVIAPYYHEWMTTALCFEVWFEWHFCPALPQCTYVIMDMPDFTENRNWSELLVSMDTRLFGFPLTHRIKTLSKNFGRI